MKRLILAAAVLAATAGGVQAGPILKWVQAVRENRAARHGGCQEAGPAPTGTATVTVRGNCAAGECAIPQRLPPAKPAAVLPPTIPK